MSQALSVMLAVLLICGCQAASLASPSPSAGPTIDPPPSTMPIVDSVSGLRFVALADLPGEVADTIALIAGGGPFPYDQDGATFENREGILPSQPSGYYHEYTVETPGSSDRGARRIVTGGPGEMFWTDDHYDSFERIRQ